MVPLEGIEPPLPNGVRFTGGVRPSLSNGVVLAVRLELTRAAL